MSKKDALTRAGRAGLIEESPGHVPMGGWDADEDPPLHPEVVDFARWFADWWLRRGRLLFADDGDEQHVA